MADNSIAIPIQVPTGGERGDLPDPKLTINDFRLLQNFHLSNEGRLVLRDGYEPLAATGPGGRIMGLHYFQTATGADRTVAANRTQLWTFDGSAWANRTGTTALTASTTQLSRFLVFSLSGTFNIIHVNEANAPQIWNGSAATFSDLGGSPPTGVDICAAANRAVMLVNPDNIRISEFNDPQTWPAALSVRLADTGDIKFGCEQMGRLAIAIYGEESEWIARAQLASFPFRFELIDTKPGPLSKAAVVRDGNIHYYLGVDGVVYRFDGIQVIVHSPAMQNYIISNLNHTSRRMSHGVLIQRIRHIFWFFPGTTASAPNRGVYLDLRTGAMGRLVFGEITASSQWRTVALTTWNDLSSFTWNNIAATYATWDAFGGAAERRELLGDSSGQVHAYGSGNGSDNGNAIEGIFELPLAPWAGMHRNFVPIGFDTYFRQTTNSTTIEPGLRVTDTLAAEPSVTSLTSFDISSDTRRSIDLSSGTGAAGRRFVSVRHRVSTSTGGVEWVAGVLLGESSEAESGPS